MAEFGGPLLGLASAAVDPRRWARRFFERRRTRVANHSMRATGITDYLKSDGSLAEARNMASHADTPTTMLYDRRSDAASLETTEEWVFDGTLKGIGSRQHIGIRGGCKA